jgi:hypothetical protein
MTPQRDDDLHQLSIFAELRLLYDELKNVYQSMGGHYRDLQVLYDETNEKLISQERDLSPEEVVEFEQSRQTINSELDVLRSKLQIIRAQIADLRIVGGID